MPMTGRVVKREIVSEEFECKIENFTLTEGPYWTPEFNFRNETWQFQVHPNLIDEYIGLCLWKKSIDSAMSVEFSVALKTSDGQKSFERGWTDIFDEWKYNCHYRWMKRTEFERRESQFLSSGCLTFIITLKGVDFVQPARRRHFFRSKCIPMNKNTSASILHGSPNMSTTSDEVQNENVSQEFEWKIENFSLNSISYWSPQFTVRSETWKFVMLPNDYDGYIGLGIRRETSGSPLLVEFSAALKTSDGQKNFERGVTEIFDEWKNSCSYLWMRRSEFEGQQTEFLSTGCLKIIITLKIVDAVEPASECDTGFQLINKTLQDYKELFLSQQNCDVVLRVKGQEFSSHKAILAARSLVFESTFRNDMKEKESGVVNIEDIDPSSFPEFLCFVYCGQIDNLSEENVFNIFTAADKYDITDLRTMCLNFMKNKLTVDTFCETIVLALLHNEKDLIKACTEFFIQNAEEITVSVKWQTFAAENPTQSNELFIKYIKSIKHSNK